MAGKLLLFLPTLAFGTIKLIAYLMKGTVIQMLSKIIKNF